uniref:Uncharacterized protein n=1 Tax=Panagrolaimus sp. ES5 TaxID=591445 RepID=A0AC34FX82_9BILA
MIPGHLEIGNRETELIVAPKLRKSVEFGGVEEHQWNPPTTTKGKEAKLYSVDEYYSQDRSARANCLWLSESILFVCLFWYSVLSFILQPPWHSFLQARNQLVEIQTPNTSLIDSFDTLITPLSVTSTFVYIVIGDKADNHLLDQIHQCSENKLQFEINRLERKAKTLPTKEKEIFLLPFVYSKDLPQNGSQSLSVEPKKN